MSSNVVTNYDCSSGTVTLSNSWAGDISANDCVSDAVSQTVWNGYPVSIGGGIPPITPEPDLFKQISTLLGIKIVNVSIYKDKVVIYGRRNKRKFVIEITATLIIVKNEKDEILTTIDLSFAVNEPITITYPQPPVQPYVYPYPGTITPNTSPWVQPYTITTGGGTLTTDSYIYNGDQIEEGCENKSI